MSILGPGFHVARFVGNPGKEAMARWLEALDRAPEGAAYEVGLLWEAERKWCVYQRIGEEILVSSSKEARALHRIFERMSKKPEWRDVGDGMADTMGALGELASEAYRKNRAGEVPPDGVAFLPVGGSA